MSDPRDHSDTPPADSDAFQAWVEHTAETRGVDKQELLNQLVSAFWILDEMNGVTADTDVPNADAHSYPPDAMGSKSTKPGSSEEPTSSRDPAVDASTEPTASDSVETPPEEAAADSESESVAGELRALRESMYGQLEMVETVTELRRQVSDLSLDVEQQRSRQEEFTDRISDDLTRIHNRIETLDSQRAQEPEIDPEAIDQLATEFSGDVERLEETHEEFESWVDEEFDHIEQLFEHLLETVGRFETRFEEIDDRIEELQYDDTADELASLRRSAIDLGVDTGRCDECGTSVDLSLLDAPQCPNCEATFTTVRSDASSWNPFAKPTIRTTDPVPEDVID